MTENEWQACTDPNMMLDQAQFCGSDRKWRLFASISCHRFYSCFITDRRYQGALDYAERYADGTGTQEEAARVERDLNDIRRETLEQAAKLPYDPGAPPTTQDAILDALDWMFYVINIPEAEFWLGESEEQLRWQCHIFRDLFGPRPFRDINLDPSWLTSSVSGLAVSIYSDRAFDRMPILGDALEDAGCDNADILNHCRQPGEHVRGCWVVDLILGKE
jgi:hypothetical protein